MSFNRNAARAPRARTFVGFALLFATALGCGVLAPLAAQAQAVAPRSYAVPAGPLSEVLNAFGRQAGMQMTYLASLTAGKRSSGSMGAATRDAALSQILEGSGLTYAYPNPATIAIMPVPADSNAAIDEGVASEGEVIVLDAVTVEGGYEEARGPFVGYLADTTATATKSGIPFHEVPQSVSAIGREEIDARSATRLSEALRYTPGVTVESDGVDSRFDSISVRGFNTANVTWLDGMRFEGGAGAGNNWTIPQIDTFTLERIEVLKGPSSSLYGQLPPGGMVNQISKRPRSTPERIVQFQADGYGKATGAVDVTGPISENSGIDYRLIVRGGKIGTEIDEGTRQRLLVAPSVSLPFMDDGQLTLHAQLQRDTGGIEYAWLPAYGTLYENPFGTIDRDTFTGEPGFNTYDRDQALGGYELEKPLVSGLTLRHALRFSRVASDIRMLQSDMYAYDDPIASPGSWDFRSLDRYAVDATGKANGVVSDTSLNWDVETGALRHRIVGGVDIYRNRFNATRLSGVVGGGGAGSAIDVFDPRYGLEIGDFSLTSRIDADLTQVGAYLQDYVEWKNWRLVGGFRRDWSEGTSRADYGNGSTTSTDQSDEALSGRVGLLYAFDNGWSPYVSYGTSFEPVVGSRFDGQSFEPMRGEQVEAGLRYAPTKDWMIAASVFDIRQTNRLTDDPLNGFPYQVQTGEVAIRGVEIEGKADLANGLALTAAYSYLDHQVTESEIPEELGRPLLYVPDHQASLWADYTVPRGFLENWKFGAGLRYTGASRGGDIETASGYAGMNIPDYTLLDLRVSVPLTEFVPVGKQVTTLNLSINNVTDERYVSGCGSIWTCGYGYGRSGYLTLTTKF